MSEDQGTHKFKLEDLTQPPDPADQDLFSQDEIEGLADLMSGEKQESSGNLDDTGKFRL